MPKNKTEITQANISTLELTELVLGVNMKAKGVNMKKVLGIFTVIMVIIFVLSICSLDSDSYVPYFTALGSLIWIGSYGVCITRD